MRLRVGHQHSQFRLILACFVDYYRLFWGPRVISTIDEPKVRLRVGHQHSQFWPILARFMDYYSPFGVQSDFHGCQTPRCTYVSVINNHSLGQFWPVSWTITLFWGLGVISTIDEPRGAFMCLSSTLTVLANSDMFRGLLLTVLGSRRDFHSC